MDGVTEGVFSLRTAADLFRKLEADLRQFRAEPRNAYLAFNFFVTAEHLPDWIHPGYANERRRRELRDSSLVLQICSHLASGAKHFQVEAKHHKSVAGTLAGGGYFGSYYYASQYFGSQFFGKGVLTVELDGKARAAFGSSIGALDLAEKVFEFWQSRFKPADADKTE